MFRVAIVEDNPKLMELLRPLFRDKARDFEVDYAESVAEGHELFDEAARHRRPFHAAVLDFNLPKLKGGTDFQIDESLCQQVSRDTFVLHMTAVVSEEDLEKDPEDEEAFLSTQQRAILRHLARFHSSRDQPRAELVCKVGEDWPDKLLEKLRTYLYNRHVERQLCDLFGIEDEGSAGLWSRKRSSGRGGELTHQLADVTANISVYWPQLSEPVKARVKRIFRVDEKREPVRVSLL
jgi:CheY-like chemotaxis protein